MSAATLSGVPVSPPAPWSYLPLDAYGPDRIVHLADVPPLQGPVTDSATEASTSFPSIRTAGLSVKGADVMRPRPGWH